jgi:hypothetical protein
VVNDKLGGQHSFVEHEISACSLVIFQYYNGSEECYLLGYNAV